MALCVSSRARVFDNSSRRPVLVAEKLESGELVAHPREPGCLWPEELVASAMLSPARRLMSRLADMHGGAASSGEEPRNAPFSPGTTTIGPILRENGDFLLQRCAGERLVHPRLFVTVDGDAVTCVSAYGK